MKQGFTKQHQETGYTQIRNEVLQNKKLSLRAKGLYSLIYSKPNGWQFSIERLSWESMETAYQTTKAIKELEEQKYLFRKKHNDGRKSWYICHDCIEPVWEKPNLQKLHVAKSKTISNKDKKSNKDDIGSSPKNTLLRPKDKERLEKIQSADVLIDDPDHIRENKEKRKHRVEEARKTGRPANWIYELLTRMKAKRGIKSISMQGDASGNALTTLRAEIQEQEGYIKTGEIKERIWKAYESLYNGWSGDKSKVTFVTLRRFWTEHDGQGKIEIPKEEVTNIEDLYKNNC